MEEELDFFERSKTSGLEVSHVPYMSLHSGGSDPLDYVIPEPNVREEVLKYLLQNGADGIHTVPLFPKLGGFANTEFATALFNDEMVKEHFGLRLWVGVSSSLDVIKPVQKVVNAIYQIMNYHVLALENHLPAVYSDKFKLWFETKDDMKELQIEFIREHQGAIKDEVSGRRFLLVLDDVLEDQMSQWDDLFTPLRYGSVGSKVIITSTSSYVVEALSDKNIRDIEAVQQDLFWEFFSRFACRGVMLNRYSELYDISRKIARHLSRFPLAGRMIGRVLNANLNEVYWKIMLEKIVVICENGELNEQHQLLLLIKLCFDELPTPICWCFKYCSIFSKDWRFTPKTLVHLWMCQGYLLSADPRENPEDVGRRYFDILVSRSFLNHVAAETDTSYKSYYVMHRFVHYLAEILSIGEFLRLDGNFKPAKAWGIRHLSISTDNLSVLRNIVGFHNIHTFITYGAFEPLTCDAVENFIKKQHRLIVLDITGCGMASFPKLYTPLKHLRYLNLTDTGIDTMHDNFTELKNLLVLNLQGCLLERLPEGMNNLKHLRHIIGPSSLISTITGIGRLTDLQELDEFSVANERGHEVGELGGLSQLRGSLCVTQLENVSSIRESRNAKLHSKSRLTSLKLEWCYPTERSYLHSAEVLEGFAPSISVEKLEITGFDGVKSPTWFKAARVPHIREIRLVGCMNWKSLPPLGELPKLEVLKVERLTSVIAVGPEFYSSNDACLVKFPLLKVLCFENMPNWVLWEEDKTSFPKLKQLELRNCPNLKQLSNLSAPLLEEMHVEMVGLKMLSLPTIKSGETSNLSHIRIASCPDLHCFSNTLRTHKVLKELVVESCPRFSDFIVPESEEDDESLPSSLERLEINSCDISYNVLRKALENLPSLSLLKVAHCPKLTMFPSLNSLRFTTTIKHLSIECCNELISLRGLEALSSLKELCIQKCPRLTIEHANSEGQGSGLLSLQNLNTDNISLLMGPLISSLFSLRELRIEGSVENNPLKRILMETPFVERLEKLALVNCTYVTAFPTNFKGLVHLKQLYLENCPGMCSLPDLASSLEELHITKCPLLEETCQEYGPDWYKISHIPYKFLDWE